MTSTRAPAVGFQVVCLIGLIAGMGVPARGAPQYATQFLGTPAGAPNTYVTPLAVNDQGHLAGYASRYSGLGEFRTAFLWTPQDGYQVLGALPGSGGYSSAVGLNNADQVVGYSGGGIAGPFLWTAQAGMLELPAPVGGNPGVATGIADDGTIAINAGPRSYAWTPSGGIRYLPGLVGGDGSTTAGPMNRNGQIAGTASSGGGPQGVIWDHDRSVQVVGSDVGAVAVAISSAGHVAVGNIIYSPGQGVTELEEVPMGGTSAVPEIRGINASGVAVGVYYFEDLYRAFVYYPGEGIFDLTTLALGDESAGNVLREANAINDAGQIVGTADGDQGPFMLTPLPEPGAVLLVCATIPLLWRRRRRGAKGRGAVLATGATLLVVAPAFADFTLVTSSGAAAPGTEAGTTFLQFGLPTLSADGKVAFQAGLAGAAVDLSNDAALYTGAPGAWQVLARKGAPADPALGAGVKQFAFANVGYDFSYALGPALSQDLVASFAYFTGPGIDYTNDTAIVAGPPAAPVRVARYGDAAPGTPAGVHFVSLSLPRINAAGQFLLSGYLDGPNLVHEHDTSRFSNDSGMWYGDATGQLTLLARSGDPVPGLPAQFVYSGVAFENNPIVNPSGQVLFQAYAANLTNSNLPAQILMTGRPGNVRKVVATGDPVPGMGDPNVRFSNGSAGSLNASGQIAYRGFFSGPGLFAPDGIGIFVATPNPAPDGAYTTQFIAR
ncbi:MAG TPA: choice-of-anchor tandem repeat NxxGxxAF-containing protein, partial [Tepidisphaeraceae bacterium]